MTIKAKYYISEDRAQINLSGDIEQIKIENRSTLVCQVLDDGRTIILKPLEDIKII